MGCNQEETDDIINCIQQLPVEQLKQSLYRGQFPNIDGDQVTRVIDGQFVRRDPKESWENGDFEAVDILIGFNSDDCNVIIRNGATALGLDFNLFLQYGIPDSTQLGLPPFALLDLIGQGTIAFQTSARPLGSTPLLQSPENVPNAELMMTMLRREFFTPIYANPTNKALEFRTAFDVCTAGVFASYATYIAQKLSAHPGVKAYMYLFSYISPDDINPDWLLNHGAFHGEEQDYLWEWRHPADTVGQGVVKAMKNVWTSFAKDG